MFSHLLFPSGGTENGKNSAALTGGIDLSVDTSFEVKLVFNTFLINSNNKYK